MLYYVNEGIMMWSVIDKMGYWQGATKVVIVNDLNQSISLHFRGHDFSSDERTDGRPDR
jgi:hypothetical protein